MLLVSVLLTTGHGALTTAALHAFGFGGGAAPVSVAVSAAEDREPTAPKSQPVAPEWPRMAAAGGTAAPAPTGGSWATAALPYGTAGVRPVSQITAVPGDVRARPLTTLGVASGRAPPSPQV
ncbi:hypothetical protein Ssi02_50630 [Sinosporangium siamense]|uniref:Uncharacterized protein n=1 Tax=Sinosporangium siamense TaxID=1367973 RepID=A0A919V9Y5_9ACTN|nr:hypothetical protein Ssi02_50630 [Sinosporangium siamense]